MTKQAPFSLSILVVDGDPDGLRVVERPNWSGKALIFPRALYTEIRNRQEEVEHTGVYLLLGPRPEGDGEMLYIGEGDPVRPRLDDHYGKKDFWTRAVIFVAPGYLNKAHVQYLESQLVIRARAAKRMLLDNINKPSEPTLSKAERVGMDAFLNNILGMLPVLGLNAFESSPAGVSKTGLPNLICKGRGVIAHGRETPQGFVVLKGSCAASDEVQSVRDNFPHICGTRADLKNSGVLVLDSDSLRFTQDYTFNSPSMASSVVLGKSSNGRTDWKDKDGKTLKQWQEEQAAT